MQLVLVNSPIQKYSDEYRPRYRTTAPLGLGYLGTIARNHGVETSIIDAEAEKLTIPEIAERVNNQSPDVVGINMTSTNYKISLEILAQIDAPHKIIGGPHATLMGDRIQGDYLVVKGEAENIFLDILHKKRSRVIDAGLVNDLNALPFVDRTLFCNDPYSMGDKREATMSTARGCPFRCVFCSVPVINGNEMRTRSIDNVISEIRTLQSQGVNSIHFIDDLFNYDKKRVHAFCDTLIEQGIDISWRDLSRVELMDDALLEKMREAGCYKLAFGIESGTPRILKYIRKCSDLDKIRNVLRKCKELGIETKAFFTIGYPTETHEEIRRTIDFAQELAPTEAYFMVVRAFPGTPLYEEMKRKGLSDEELINYKQFQDEDGYVKYHVMNFNSLNGMPVEQLDNYVKDAYSRFYNKPEDMEQ